MELVVRHDGREERLEVERDGDRARVTIGGRTFQVDVAKTGPVGRSLLVDGAQHEVVVLRQERGVYRVGLSAGEERVEVVDALTHLAREAHGGGGTGTETVTAYMPGRVKGVLVEEGAEVTVGTGIVVLEAMKMENEIQADRDGVVKRIFVEEGQAVDGGDPLFEIG